MQFTKFVAEIIKEVCLNATWQGVPSEQLQFNDSTLEVLYCTWHHSLLLRKLSGKLICSVINNFGLELKAIWLVLLLLCTYKEIRTSLFRVTKSVSVCSVITCSDCKAQFWSLITPVRWTLFFFLSKLSPLLKIKLMHN